MILSRFYSRLRDYGISRILTGTDFLIALSLILLLGVIQVTTCILQISPLIGGCVQFRSPVFVNLGTNLAFSLTAFILAGLAILVSFTDKDFLADLKDWGVYENLMFVFQYNLYLALLVSVFGILSQAYGFGTYGFYLFAFLFIYMVLSIADMIDLIVTIGNQKARYEMNQTEDS